MGNYPCRVPPLSLIVPCMAGRCLFCRLCYSQLRVTECAIFNVSFIISLKIPQCLHFIFSSGERHVQSLAALGCSFAKRFPAKSLADLFLPSHDMTSPRALVLIWHPYCYRSGESTESVLSTTSTPGTVSTSSTGLPAGMSAIALMSVSSAPVPTMPCSCVTC